MKKKRIFAGVAIIVVIMAISFVQTVEVGKKQTKTWVVAVDAGHGGYDPGKVGVSGVLEKDINLAETGGNYEFQRRSHCSEHSSK